MEAAAAFIAVITLSLQSTKFVYQTVEEIRDGPSVVKELAERARKLEGLLQRLQQLVQHGGQSARAQDPSVWKPLETKVTQCSSDLQETASKLKALEHDKTKHPLDRAWTRIKVSLKEKDLKRFGDQMQYHVVELGLELQIIHGHLGILSDVDKKQHMDVIQASLNSTKDQLNLHSTDLKKHFSENAQQLESSFTKLAANVHDSDRRQEERSQQMLDDLQNIGHLVADRTHDAQHRFQQGTHQLTEEFATRLDKLQTMSAEQYDAIIDRLHRIELQGSVISETINSGASNSVLSMGDPNCQPEETSQEELKMSAAIDRLCNLASSIAQVCYSEDAEEIIDDLGCVLDAILHQAAGIADKSFGATKRKRYHEDHSEVIHHNIKRVRGLLSASCAVELDGNIGARSPYSSTRTQKLSKCYTEIFNMNDCTAVVSLKTASYHGVGRRRKEGTLRGSISIVPRKSTKRAKISAYFLQRLTGSGFNSLNPMLLFHPIVPDNAEILDAVKTGNVNMMLELFNAGKASLQDCDSEGRSLLNFAIRNEQLLSCHFLVAHGADVDSIEKSFGHESYGPPLFGLPLDVRRIGDKDRLQICSAIRHCLLENGADPLSVVDFGSHQSNSFAQDLQYCHPDTLSMYLRHSRDYINLEERDDECRTPLLQMLAAFQVIFISEIPFDYDVGDIIIRKTQILLSHGVDIDTRDTYGRGCLHTLLDVAKYTYFGHTSEKTIPEFLQAVIKNMVYLIYMGADMHAVDYDGFSVTECAHSLRRGRVWEEALKQCEIDVQEVYTRDYRLGRAFSNDIFAPDGGHPRLVHTLDRVYYDRYMGRGIVEVLLLEPLDNMEEAGARLKDLTDTESSEHDDESQYSSDYSDESQHSDDDRVNEVAEDKQQEAKEVNKSLGGSEIVDPAEYSDSDDETGGVLIA